MACILDSGYTLGCREGVGGVAEFYIGTWNGDELTYTLGTDDIIGTFSGGTSSFYTFEQDIEVASFNQNGQFSTENGTVFYEQTFEATIQRITAAIRNQIKVLAAGKWRILIKDNNGSYYLMGLNNPVRLNTAVGGLGKAMGDLNGYVLTFMVKEPTPIVQVDATAALQLIA